MWLANLRSHAPLGALFTVPRGRHDVIDRPRPVARKDGKAKALLEVDADEFTLVLVTELVRDQRAQSPPWAAKRS